MSDETSVASQVLPASGAFDNERLKPAPDGNHTMEIVSFNEKPSSKGDSVNHEFRLVSQPANGEAKTFAYARINFKPEWLEPTRLAELSTKFREYSKLQGAARKEFTDKEAIRASIALKQINRIAAYLGLVDMQTGQVDWQSYPTKVKDSVNLTVAVHVTQKDQNDQSRRDITKQGKAMGLNGADLGKYVESNFDAERARAEADFNYPAGWKTA